MPIRTRIRYSVSVIRYPLISVLHEGIDTQMARPNPTVELKLDGVPGTLTRADEVLTYVARNLEPYCGFHIFMRALPDILRRRPNARALIVGGDEVSSARRPPEGETIRKRLLEEVSCALDLSRVHSSARSPTRPFSRSCRFPRCTFT